MWEGVSRKKERILPKPHPTVPAAFQHEAVQLAQTSGKPQAQSARELGISESAWYGWWKQALDQGNDAFAGKGQQTPLEEDNHRRKRAGARVPQERDRLQQASSIFSRTQL
jgi:transposase